MWSFLQDADLQTEAPPEASALLAALRQIDFKHVQATVRDTGNSTGQRLSLTQSLCGKLI